MAIITMTLTITIMTAMIMATPTGTTVIVTSIDRRYLTAATAAPSAMSKEQKTTACPRRRASTVPDKGRARAAEAGSEAASADALSRLLIWLSPAYPVGGFSYSHGLEWTVEAGKVRDAATLGGWVEDILRHGAGRSDAILLAEAWRAVAENDARRLAEAVELVAALAPSAERRLETLAQGAAFLAATRTVWPSPALDRLAEQVAEVAYPVAVGACAAAHALPLAPTARAFMQAFAANLVSAGVRLVPLGQTDGLRVLARLEPLIPALAAAALAARLEDVGGAAVMADIASMRHETQYTRLFRS
jgi:urease accessory protein